MIINGRASDTTREEHMIKSETNVVSCFESSETRSTGAIQNC
jgi:hypothetical protein